jgi:hypothetical protein
MAMFNSYVKLPEGIWIYQPTQAKSMSFFFQIFPETNSGININKKDLQLMMPTRIILNCLIRSQICGLVDEIMKIPWQIYESKITETRLGG